MERGVSLISGRQIAVVGVFDVYVRRFHILGLSARLHTRVDVDQAWVKVPVVDPKE